MREADVRNKRSTEDIAMGIRRRVFEHSMRNNGGYLSQACSAAEQLAFLYNEALNLGRADFAGRPPAFRRRALGGKSRLPLPAPVTTARSSREYDRLFIAPAHYALVAYATLIEVGRMDAEGLEMFNKDGSSVEMIGAEHSPGMEVHNGTLGIGLSTGGGPCLWPQAAGRDRRVSASSCPTARCRKARRGRPCRPRRTITGSTTSGR
jgi:transketolase